MVVILGKDKQNSTGFGARLKALRVAAGITQEKLAELAGMRPQNITRLETGGREPAWETVIRLAKALNVHTDDFLPQAE